MGHLLSIVYTQAYSVHAYNKPPHNCSFLARPVDIGVSLVAPGVMTIQIVVSQWLAEWVHKHLRMSEASTV